MGIPEEDANLEYCQHFYKVVELASGFSRATPDKYVLSFFCQRCLMTRKKIVDVSDQHIPPIVIEEYTDEGLSPV